MKDEAAASVRPPRERNSCGAERRRSSCWFLLCLGGRGENGQCRDLVDSVCSSRCRARGLQEGSLEAGILKISTEEPLAVGTRLAI